MEQGTLRKYIDFSRDLHLQIIRKYKFPQDHLNVLLLTAFLTLSTLASQAVPENDDDVIFDAEHMQKLIAALNQNLKTITATYEADTEDPTNMTMQ